MPEIEATGAHAAGPEGKIYAALFALAQASLRAGAPGLSPAVQDAIARSIAAEASLPLRPTSEMLAIYSLTGPPEFRYAKMLAVALAQAQVSDPAEGYGPGRCEVCAWPLADSPERGCVAGDCSYRPEDPAERKRFHARRSALAQREATRG